VNYTVQYAPRAERQLIELWLNPISRAAVSLSADEIDRRLGTDPLAEGESREADLRVLLVPPLRVIYQVSSADRVVQVLDVWMYRRRR
jgi:hypothetical protein